MRKGQESPELARAGARGLVAALAMSGLRTVTGSLGLMRRTPPEQVVELSAPRMMRKLPTGGRTALVEGAHCVYGVAGGVVYALLPERIRQQWWAGPCYGVAVWLVFEAAIAPVLGLRHPERRKLLARAALVADHALYGVVVAGGLAPRP